MQPWQNRCQSPGGATTPAAAPLPHRFWADYIAQDFHALDRARLVAVLPVGAIEQHGPNLPPSVDRDIPDGIISAALPLMPAGLPALILPTCAVGKSDEHAAYPGTLTLSAATLIAVWSDLGASVARAGMRRIVLLNSHGGQMAPLDIVACDLRIRHPMIAVAAKRFAWGMPPGILSEVEARWGVHAGQMAPALMQALRPAGAAGNATLATPEDGRWFIDPAARELVALLEEVAPLPPSVPDATPDPGAEG